MKKIVVLLIAISLVFSMAACSNSKLAKIDKYTVTKADIQTQLDEAQKEILKTYVYESLVDKFYEDAKVTDAEVQAKVAQVKAQYPESDWGLYLSYYGFKDEDTFAKATKRNMQREQKLTEIRKEIKITDEEAEAEYNKNPTYYQYAEVDAIFFYDKESKDRAWELIQEGKTLEEAAQETSGTFSENEKAPIAYDEFMTLFSESEVGDIIKTKDTSSDFIIAKINKINLTFEDVKDLVKNDYIYYAASDVLDQQIEDFFSNTSVEIMGEKIDATTLIKSSYDY